MSDGEAKNLNDQTPKTKAEAKIAFGGEKGHGKSTCAEYLVDSGYKEFAFAGPLKQVISLVFNLPMEWLTDPKLKETVYSQLNVTPRQLCIAVGSDLFRDALKSALPQLRLPYAGDVWTNKLFHDIREVKSPIVVSDARLPTEYEHLKAAGFTVVRVERPSVVHAGPKHATEQGIPFDIRLVNDGTKEDLYKKIDSAILGVKLA